MGIQNDISQIWTLTGILLTFLVGVAGLFVGIHNSQNTIFVNSVTKARIKHIRTIRKMISEFCGLLYYYDRSFKKVYDSFERNKVLYRLCKLKYQIFLSLNPDDKEWDYKIILLIEELSISLNKRKRIKIKIKIKKLLLLTQYMLTIEWEGVKRESKKGAISKIERDKFKEECRLKYNIAEKRLLKREL